MDKMEPVFLCGALRTGTTVLGLMLRYHPQVIAPGEFDFLFDCISETGEFPQTDYYLNWLTESRIFQAHNLEVNSSESFKQNIDSMLTQLSKPEHLLCLNIHRHFSRIPLLFPNARYIHLMRDARDVARSSIGMGWSGNVYYGVDHWIETEKSWRELKPELKDEQYIEVKFEDLIAKPTEVLTAICEFLEIPYSSEMLNYNEGTTYSKPDMGLVRQWERKQSKAQVQLVEYKAGELMESQGYQLSGNAISKPNIFTRLGLSIQNRIFRMRFGVHHFGFVLFFAEKITRIPIFYRWHKKCVLKMNVLELKLLK